jgi:outer membrane immunogenic protein
MEVESMHRIFPALATATAFAIAATATVSAADIASPVYVPPPPAPALYNWTGVYVGVHAGGAWSKQDWFYPCTTTNLLLPPCNLPQGGHSGTSWLAGGQVGFNYQVERWVWGIEAEFSATRLKGNHVDVAFPANTHHSRTDFIGTVAPRVGLTWDRALLYVKGGAAWVNNDFSLLITPPSVTAYTPNAARWGWMAGLGIEYAFAQNWSAKVEYNYLDFGTEHILYIGNGALPGAVPFDENIRQRIQVVKVGLNYKFDWGAPLDRRY